MMRVPRIQRASSVLIVLKAVHPVLEEAVQGRAPSVIQYSTLESISPPLQRRLAQHVSEVIGEDLRLPFAAWLHDVATRDHPSLPTRLREGLDGISAIASDDACEVLLDAAAARGIDFPSLYGARSAADYATLAYLDHPVVFEDARTQIRSVERRLFSIFARPHGRAPISKAQLLDAEPALRQGVNEWLGSRGRPAGCDIVISETQALIEVTVVSQQMLAPYRTADRSEVVAASAKNLDVLLFDPSGDMVAIHTPRPVDAEFYRRLVGRVLYENAGAFTPSHLLRIDRLLSATETSDATALVPGLSRVAIRKIQIETPQERVSWSGRPHVVVADPNLVDFIEKAERVTSVELDLYPAERSFPCPIILAPPNRISFDHRAIARHAFRFLRARGILQVR